MLIGATVTCNGKGDIPIITSMTGRVDRAIANGTLSFAVAKSQTLEMMLTEAS